MLEREIFNICDEKYQEEYKLKKEMETCQAGWK